MKPYEAYHYSTEGCDMPKYTVTGWRVVSQWAICEIEAESAEAAKLAALEVDESGYTPLDLAGFEDCGDPEEVDEIRVTNDDTGIEELNERLGR